MKKKKAFLINTAFYGLIAALAVLFLKYGLKYIMPFLLGFIIAYLCRKPTEYLASKTKMNSKLCSILVLTVVFILLFLFCILVVVQAASGITSLFRSMPAFYANQVEPYVQQILQWYENTNLEDYIGEAAAALLESTADQILSSLGSLVTTLSMRVVSIATSFISGLPSFMMTFLLTIISAFFISIDYDNIIGFLARQLSPRTRELMSYVKVSFVDTIGKYIASYLLILGITYIELIIVLLIAGVSNAVLLALVIASFDILPIVGTGTVFWPWVIIDILAGRYYQAIVLAIGYIVITVIRNIIEPRILGQKVGLHPIVTLMAMYVGLKAFGFVGLFMLPITLVMLNEMQTTGLIKLYKTVSAQEAAEVPEEKEPESE